MHQAGLEVYILVKLKLQLFSFQIKHVLRVLKRTVSLKMFYVFSILHSRPLIKSV